MSRIVYFDLETTRTINVGDAEIIQIGAIGHDGQNPPEFNRFIYPRGNVIPKKFQKKGGSLIKNGVRLQNVQNLDDALDDFMLWLDENFVDDRGVILLSHGAYNGDAANLMRSLHQIGYEDIEDTIEGFSDTAMSARYFHEDLCSWKLSHLKKIYGLKGGVSHDALADAKDLRNVIDRMRNCEEHPDLYLVKFLMKTFKFPYEII